MRQRLELLTGDVELILQTCADLASWQAATIRSTNVVETDEGFEVVEVEVPASGSGSGFFRLEALLALPAGEE